MTREHFRRRDWLGMSLAGSLSSRIQAEPPIEPVLEVVYPNVPERPRDAYGYRLLDLALTKAGVPHQIRLAAEPMTAHRARIELGQGFFNVMDSGTAPDLEGRFDWVPFPLDLGLSGCRLLLARRETLPALGAVRTLTDLRKFRFGQGTGWIDTDILRSAGFRVETGQFLSLFRMLEAKRFDVFPLGVEEAHAMLSRYGREAPSVVVADGLALHYPFARVYMVRKGQTRLRDALLLGLKRAHADGSLQKLLSEQAGLGPIVSGKQGLPARLISIPNPWESPVYRAIEPQYLHPAIRSLPRG